MYDFAIIKGLEKFVDFIIHVKQYKYLWTVFQRWKSMQQMAYC